MPYYKVVDEIDGRLYSAAVRHDYQIEYEINKEIFPRSGTNGIFVFKELSDAVTFINSSLLGCVRIYTCDVKNPRRLEIRAHSFIAIEISYFWDAFNKVRKSKKKICKESLEKFNSKLDFFRSFSLYKCPENTYIASSVILRERVNSW